MDRDFYCESLLEAIKFEEKGKEFYEKALHKVQDIFAKKALEFLIAEEDKHIDKILRFNEFLFGRGDFDIETECNTQIKEKIKELIENHVSSSMAGKIEDASTDIEVYQAAMDFEKKGYELYKESAENTDDERIKVFFNFLINEEIKHYDLLENTLRYLKEPDYYFEDYGGWVFS
ncbi:MAG: ferritin family protein [Actinobacteria bacterium]|nr:ferritin family protein [Actinomycetota bacterium]